MKANTFVAVLLLTCLACTSRQSDQLTQQQKDQIKDELKAIGDSVIARWERLDAVGALEYYSPDLLVAADSLLIDFQVYKKGWVDFNTSVASIKVTPIREDFTFITNDVVIWTWFGKDETTLKTGDKETYNPHTYVSVFKKVAGQWRGIYLCSSGTPVVQKAGKK